MLPAGWAFDGDKKPIGYQKSCIHDYSILPLWKQFHFPSSFNPLNHLTRPEDSLSVLVSLLGFLSLNSMCPHSWFLSSVLGFPFSIFFIASFSTWLTDYMLFFSCSVLPPVPFSLFGNWSGVEGPGEVRLGGSRESSQGMLRSLWGTDWPLLTHPFPLPLGHIVGEPSPDFPAVMSGITVDRGVARRTSLSILHFVFHHLLAERWRSGWWPSESLWRRQGPCHL